MTDFGFNFFFSYLSLYSSNLYTFFNDSISQFFPNSYQLRPLVFYYYYPHQSQK